MKTMLNVRCWRSKQTPCCGAVIAGFDPSTTLAANFAVLHNVVGCGPRLERSPDAAT